MEITRMSKFTDITRTLDLDVTQEQLKAYYDEGALLQNAFPHLPPDEREFIKTGTTAEEWIDMSGTAIGPDFYMGEEVISC